MRLARFSFSHPRTVLTVAVLLSAAAAIPLTTLSTEQNLARLLPQDLPSIRAFTDIRENFDVESNLFVLLEGNSPTELLDGSDAYVKRLKSDPLVAAAHNRLTDDQHRYYFELLPKHLFLTLPEEDLRNTLEFLQNPDALRAHMEDNYRRLITATALDKERIRMDPLDLAGRARVLQRRTETGGRTGLTEEGYFLSEDGRAILVHVRGTRPAQDIAYARELVQAVRDAAPEGLDLSLAGGYAVAVQDEGMIRRDMIQSSTISFVVILLLFWIVFRDFGAMLRLGIPLLMAVLWAVAVVALAFGRLNPLLAGSATIIAGLGIDFSIHLMTRFHHELSLKKSPLEAVSIAAARVGRGLLIAAATTVSVFYSFLVSDLRGMAEFGVATGTGVLLCLLTTHTVLPALLALGRPRARGILPILRAPAGGGRVLLVSGVLLLAAVAVGIGGFSFESDWKNLRPRRDPALETQERIGRMFWGSSESVSLLVRGEPVRKFERLQPALEELRRRDILAGYRTVTSILPPIERQKRNIEILKDIDVDRILENVYRALDTAGFRTAAFQTYLEGVATLLRRKRFVDESLLREHNLTSLLDPHVAGDLGTAQLFTRQGLWERETRQHVIGEIRTVLETSGVAVELTGFKIVSGDLETRLRGDFARLFFVAAGVIVVITFLVFRSPTLVILAALPLLGGLALMAAVMNLAGLHVNVMNLIAFPMVVGIGIDDGIHLVHLYRDTRSKTFEGLLPVCLRAVCLTTLTTVVAFGSLALTENRGVSSMGLLAAIGMICCLLPSLWTLPAALRLLNRRRE